MNDDSALIPMNNVDKEISEIADKILVEEDLDALKKLTALFNLNQARKNVLRVMKLNGIYDKATNNILKRVEEAPGEFSNLEMIKLMSVLEESIDKAQKGLGVVDETPTIQFNQQNNVNVVVGDGIDLNRDERQNVMDAINALLSGKNNTAIESSNETDEN